MTKSQSRDVKTIRIHAAIGNTHAAAAGLSALIRSALRAGDRAELLAVADELGLRAHPAFIV
jgi:hypothetical protein